MLRLPLTAILFVTLGASSIAQPPPRALVDALNSIFRLSEFTVFDWIAGRYDRGTLTLEGFARTPSLKKRAQDVARKSAGVDQIVNNIEVLPAHSLDDEVRVRAYAAIYTSSALERYGPRGSFSRALLSDLAEASRFGLDGTDIGRGPHAIHIVVSGARIILHGEVRTAGDRQIAEATLRSLPGILGVTNQLRVP